MEIKREEHGKKGAFFIEQDSEWVAEMTYVKSGENEITIDHTEVDKSLQDKGVGKDLVAEGVKYARENNLKIVPVCPFVKKIIDETPEFQDVLAG